MAISYSYQAAVLPGGMNFILRSDTNAATNPTWIPLDLSNMDYQGFLLWMNEGNPAPEGWSGPTNTVASSG